MKNDRHFYFAVRKKTNGRCWYCGKETLMQFTYDHLKPKSKGGRFQIQNLVPACQPCNARKADMTVEEYRKLFFGEVYGLEERQAQVLHDLEKKIEWHKRNIAELKRMEAEKSLSIRKMRDSTRETIKKLHWWKRLFNQF